MSETLPQQAVTTHPTGFIASSFLLRKQGLLPLGKPPLREWLECGRLLRHAQTYTDFWIGDWLSYGIAHLCTDYRRASHITGISVHILQRDHLLATRIPFPRRRFAVATAIYHEVAPLEKDLQELLLAKAEAQSLTLYQMRAEKSRLLLEANRPKPSLFASHLYLGNCLDVLADLPDASIDCIVTDPPYGIHYQSRSRALPLDRIAGDDEHACEMLEKALSMASRKLKQNSHVYIFTNWNAYASMSAVVAKYFTLKNVLIWEKNGWTRGDLQANYGYQYEMILYAHKGRRHLFGRRDPNVLHINKVPSNHMQHPTEKPVKLLEYLIAKSTLEGEIVLDMFMGAGSTCLAAKHTNRRYIGIEMEKQWFEVAHCRLQFA